MRVTPPIYIYTCPYCQKECQSEHRMIRHLTGKKKPRKGHERTPLEAHADLARAKRRVKP